MTDALNAKIFVVTGGFGVLGQAVAEAAARRGATVAAIDSQDLPPAGLAGALGCRALLLDGVDLTKPDHARAAIEAISSRFGRLDVLVNIAGGFRWETIADGDSSTWDALYALNVKTTLNACRAALPHLLRNGGRIVNVGAHAALKAAAGMGAYAGSKAAVHRLTESLAEELKGRVAVNAVLPSIIDTPANRDSMPGAQWSRWVSPGDLATVILFLASDDARAVTGALVPVTGSV